VKQNTIKELENTARLLRRDVLEMIFHAGDGHPGPSLSVADIVTALYFETLRIKPADPAWPERDRFILSKGHACPVLYAALARLGFFPQTELAGLRSLSSMLQGHPDMNKTPGIDTTSGSLGNGISIGLGMALAARMKNLDYSVYVVTGDGELEEGVVWESLMAAVKYRVGNLIVIIDNNGMQSGGSLGSISGLEPIMPKLEAFGWHCQEIDGHDFREILHALNEALTNKQQPSVILAHTVKGQGVPFMIGDNSWHKRVPTEEELHVALQALGGGE
jgi:transketolase